MARISQTTLKRLDRLDEPLRAERQRAAYVIALHTGHVADSDRESFTKAQRTILSWPRIPSTPDEWADWERVASASQDRLVAASWEDRSLPKEPQHVGIDPAIRTQAYKPSPVLPVLPAYVGAESK